jgi:hypothetical protein
VVSLDDSISELRVFDPTAVDKQRNLPAVGKMNPRWADEAGNSNGRLEIGDWRLEIEASASGVVNSIGKLPDWLPTLLIFRVRPPLLLGLR